MAKKDLVKKCRVIDLPKVEDERGSLTYIEQNNHVPFKIKRVYYIYDVPKDEKRGKHAHKKLEQVMICLNGSFDVILNDVHNEKTYTLSSPYSGLYIHPGVWREMENFSSNSVALVLASTLFDENDYIRNYEEYKEYIKEEEFND